MDKLQSLREEARTISWVIKNDPTVQTHRSAQEYLQSLRPEILMLFTARCLIIIDQLANLTDKEVHL